MEEYQKQLFANYAKTHGDIVTGNNLVFINDYASCNYKPLLETVNPEKDVVLEIGCNNGSLLYYFRTSLKIKNLVGIDLSNDDIEIAKQLMPEAQLLCCDAFEYLLNNKNKFNCIILKAVLEHINKQKVIPFLELINQSLTEDGFVIIDVPNMDWLFASHERYMDFTHEVGFTRESLGQIMRNVFLNVRIIKSNRIFPRNIMQKMKYFVRNWIVIPFVNIIFKILGSGEQSTWWDSRSIIAIGYKKCKMV